jgi:starch synthase
MQRIESSAGQYPEQFRLIAEFDPLLARRLYGGGDFVLVPSLYEPCGLTQMMAMRYGAIPIVRETGGLADTVKDGKTGLTFKDASGLQCRDAILRGIELFKKQNEFEFMQDRCMHADYSWDRANVSYEKMYTGIVQRHRTTR